MSTGIQWTDATWNPLRARHRTNGSEGWACVRVSDGCKNCYASTQNATMRWGHGTGLDYTVPALAQVETYLDEATLTQPLRWRKPRRIFVCSMTDLFGEWVTDEQIDRVFAVMALTPQHTYQVLTKRPERMRAWFEGVLADDEEQGYRADRINHAMQSFDLWPDISEEGFAKHGIWPLPNVWLGVSVEDQQRADERIPILLDTPAAVRFLSCEPLLGSVDVRRYMWPVHARWPMGFKSPEDAAAAGAEVTYHRQSLVHRDRSFIDWVIVGGESGKGARPFDLAWARSLRDQCEAAGVPVFVKQLGGRPYTNPTHRFGQDWLKLRHTHGGNPEEWPEDLRVREFPATSAVGR